MYYSLIKLNELFIIKKVRHRKSYAQEGEEVRRLRTWKRNKARFQRHNIEALDGKHSYTLGENQFTDKVTPIEWCNLYTMLAIDSSLIYW